AQQNGSISGNVTTSDGNPAAMVSVAIQSTTHGTMTNENGNYRIGRVKAGTYTLTVSAVGLAPQSKEVTVTAGASTVVNFTLDINNAQLQEVVIKGKTNTIKLDNPSPSLRVETPLLELSQNVQSVSSASLSQQQIISMSDGVIRNVSGAVRLEHWGDLYTNISMRGSQIQAFRNGFNVVSSFWGPLTEDVSLVDHIEFVKGPAGFMIGNGDGAGLYNVVTKKPTGQNKGEFSLTTGSYGLYRASLDLDGKLSNDGKLLYRLNLAAQNKNSFRAYEYNNRYTIAPVLSYQVSDDTKLTFEYNYQKAKMSDVGSFYVFSPDGYAAYDQNFTMMQPGLAPTNINDHSLYVLLNHRFNDNWRLTAQASYFNYMQSGTSLWPDSVAANGQVARGAGIWDAKSEMTMAQAFINGTVQTGGIRHRILGGIDAGSKNYMADWSTTHILDTPDSMFDPANPTYGYPSNGYPNFDRTLNLEARAVGAGGTMIQEYTGLYVQDELGLLDNKLRVTIAGRYTYLSQADWGGSPITAKKFTPRFGASYSITSDFAAYGLYDQAFMPQSAGRLIDGGNVKPITGSNLEFGLKKDWAQGKWNTTISVYQNLRNNEATADATSTPQNPVSFLLGQRKAQGIEFDLRGELAQGLTLTANYALTDSRVTKVGEFAGTQGIAVGDITPGYAKHVTNAWLNYKLQDGILKGVGVSAGFTGLFDRETDYWSDRVNRLPAYYKVDAGAFWENSKLRITGNVFNVFNKYLYSGSYYSAYNYNADGTTSLKWAAYSYQAEAPRNYRLSVTYRF
ncbi:MAG: TonB-dependent receptor, partial [Sphingobacteriales bacterium]